MSTFLHPRIWRYPFSDFYDDEPLHAANHYTDRAFADIRSHGFDGVWLRGRLRQVMHTQTLPALNASKRDQRIDSLNTIIERGRQQGIGVWLYFNEPLAPFMDDPVWNVYPELKGEEWYHPLVDERSAVSLCTSIPIVRQWFSEAVDTTFQALPGLAGVLLITASEWHTHCWSHVARRSLKDGVHEDKQLHPECPRCRKREPSEVVGELVRTWTDSAKRYDPSPRVIVWNWSWSMWYPDPQAEVIDALPAEAELMADFERGSVRQWHGRQIDIDEYALSFIGPSDRFTLSRRCAQERGLPMHAKLQIGTTHEIGNVPNLPLIGNLHAKCCNLHRDQVRGAMCTWNFGCMLTLNSFALCMFAEDPERYCDRDVFFAELTRRYFGDGVDVEALGNTWLGFAEAFDHYPFSIPMIYYGPMNRAPAWPFRLRPLDEPTPPCHLAYDKEWGDNFERAYGGFTLDEIIAGFTCLADEWYLHLPGYVEALAGDDEHRVQERNTAQVIGCQMRSTANLFQWHRWRGEGRDGLDDPGRAIIDSELATIEAALPLVKADDRFGMHLECQAYLYDASLIKSKIGQLKAMLG